MNWLDKPVRNGQAVTGAFSIVKRSGHVPRKRSDGSIWNFYIFRNLISAWVGQIGHLQVERGSIHADTRR